MAGLKIINSPNARIMTQCEHCKHIMKTTADTLYYLVECPSCTRDFIVKRYKEAVQKVKKQVKPVRESVYYSVSAADDTFIKTVHSMAWPVYKTGIGFCLVGGVFMYGYTNDWRLLPGCILAIVLLTILHYFVLCTGNIYLNSRK